MCLTITNDTGCTSTYCEDIVVVELDMCYADFYYMPNDGLLSLDFIDLSGSDATAWAWDFGDGNTSTEQNPTHTYADYGEYMVCLTITGDDGCSAVQCYGVVLIDPAACEAHFWHSAFPGDSSVLGYSGHY